MPMKSHVSLYRWFRDIPIARKLYFTVGIMALLIGIELFVLLFSLSTLSSLRAYVGGEGLWSKAQKDAVFHLHKYGTSRTEEDYRLFERFMRVPLGDAAARQELLSSRPDMAAARAGFLEGRNHPDDIDGMIDLFTRFSNVSYIEQAIRVWGDAQSIALQLPPLARELHQEINSVHPSQDRINATLAAIYDINRNLTQFEDAFSFTLGEGSLWLERLLRRLLLLTALTVEATGLLLAVSVSRGIQRGLGDILTAARQVSAGELNARATVRSHDEIGTLARSFNAMAQHLQARVKDLARLNQELEREVGDRQRAEAELQEAFAQLETTIGELKRQIAERLRTEEMLRQSEKMKALGQLSGGIAHDFNNLLGVIVGCAEMLADTMQDQPEQEGLAREIIGTALRGSVLTRRLLAVSRNQPLRPQRVDLGALLQDHVELLRRTLGEAIRIEARQAGDLWFTSADPSQIGDALLNLALNARDAMPQGGRLGIEVVNAHLDARRAAAFEVTEGDYVMLALADTGTGMPKEVMRRAIEPFFTTKPPSAGSGLGLSMVYGFAKQSGGHLDLDSVVGAGTTVRLYLPRAPEEAVAQAAAPPVAAPDPRGSETILLVDDNQTLMEVVRRQLAALGYRVLTAASGPAALAILRAGEAVDLLFTDIVLPDGMSGTRLARTARRLRPGLKILFTTGHASGLPRQERQNLLRKPYDRRDLARAVRAALDEVTLTR
ncbi:Histidine kinase [Rhodovastum atsumiense]|uniref:histidine kinase n=1 Tax=Rhodovastum atsumiense TaxID=504468 RepID=A0A5M6ITV2_9PROT|nr:hybrid sensor histidine kinase/response regulator [Rhodovastum atsumiense]KAA5610865.1 response regulator [Rhodovastum atsumiense]CAH2602079.1 Histidine kinase [Rhodovastum atsumiense]